ncbi:hypothetical protein [Arthrobacter dokdonensis]|uniref:hypothetical protein n=1 Tax=Arthrobacter dokdonellae TaxID=2211210 RepID=UPI000DE5AC9F|nr:hypothetical protein [Arthrobacter dokdonellae]
MIEHLVSVRDAGRSVSKTHLPGRPSEEGLWVTDRNSTYGSAVANTAGRPSTLRGDMAARAGIGATVHFGDRSFQVGRA